MREIRRRTRVVGAFPDGQSCLNLAAARLRYIAGTAWTGIERFHPYPPHQRLNVPTTAPPPLGRQQAAQHSRAGEWKVQMQPVETSHHVEVGRRHRAWQVVDAATTDPKNLCLLGDRQIVLTVDHRFALSNPALV